MICSGQFNDTRAGHSGQEALLVSFDVDHRGGFERLDCRALLGIYWHIKPERIVRSRRRKLQRDPLTGSCLSGTTCHMTKRAAPVIRVRSPLTELENDVVQAVWERTSIRTLPR